MNKETTTQQATQKSVVRNFSDGITKIMRMNQMTKDCKVSFGTKKSVIVPAGTTGKNLTRSTVAAMLNIKPIAVSRKLKQEGLTWTEQLWGEAFLQGGTFNYLCDLVENKGWGWVTISDHLAQLGIHRSASTIGNYYKTKKGIFGSVDNDHQIGTRAVQLCHIAIPVPGIFWLVRQNTPGIYLDKMSHNTLDEAATLVWRSNGLIYAIYGPNSKDLLATNRLINGNPYWIANNFRTRFENKLDEVICAEMNLNIDCLLSFTPGPIKN